MRCSEEPPAIGEYGIGVISGFADVPVASLAEAVEKVVAKMDEHDLAAALEGNLATMPSGALRALVAAVLEAFRDRGESSEDAAEACGLAPDTLDRSTPPAAEALIRYAATNAGVLKEALAVFVSRDGTLFGGLPQSVRDGVAAKLTPIA